VSPNPSAPRELARRPGARHAGALATGAALAALLAAGCELKRGPGPKPYVTPAFKTFVVEHPVALGGRPVFSGTTELRIDRAVTEERKTVLRTEEWRMVVHVALVNHGQAPLLQDDIRDAFQLLGRSGATRRGYVSTEGGREGGWLHQEHTGQPTHVPPGGTGRVRIWAVAEPVTTRDDPAALTFRDVRIDFR
jgi:hypothetical protein